MSIFLIDRSWMYQRIVDGYANRAFGDGVQAFLSFTESHPEAMDGPRIRCPCARCKNKKYKLRDEVTKDLLQKGFVGGYEVWIHHGEDDSMYGDYFESQGGDDYNMGDQNEEDEVDDPMFQMVHY